MMKNTVFILISVVVSQFGYCQVGINTTSPNAQLEIKSSNQATPANTDGILIPKIDAFPIVNPTAAQNAMMVYLTTSSLGKPPGFYYWDSATVDWLPLTKQDYDFLNTSGIAPTTIGETMYHVGNTGIGTTTPAATTKLDVKTTTGTTVVTGEYGIPANNANISVFNAKIFPNAGMSNGKTFGLKNELGTNSAVEATGVQNLISGSGTGDQYGVNNQFLSTGNAKRYGFFNSFNATNDESYGLYNYLPGTGSKFGIYNDFYNGNGASYANYNIFDGSANGDRYGNLTTFWGDGDGDWYGNYVAYEYLSSVGATGKKVGYLVAIPPAVGGTELYGVYSYVGNLTNGYAGYLDGRVSIGSNADITTHYILPLSRGTNGQIMQTDGSGNVTWVSTNTFASGTLDQAYDFGGAGAGRTIIADSGAVTIAGTDGLVATGTSGSGATMPTGAGSRMVWNPRTGSFRAGQVNGTQWDAGNVGGSSVALGNNTIASGAASTAFGYNTEATSSYDTAFGAFTHATGSYSTAWGAGTTASGHSATSFGNTTIAAGNLSTAFGVRNTASSYGETVLGIGAKAYTPSTGGATAFQTANATDRLFVIGNGIDTNGNSVLDDAERSNGMVMLKNGNTAIGTDVNNMHRLYVYKQQPTALGDGQSTLRGFRTRDSRNDGIGYGTDENNNATSGYNIWGDSYTFGVVGHCDNDYTRTGGILGAVNDGSYWSSLGYKSSASVNYGIYASAAGYAQGAGRMSQASTEFSVGGGFYGGLIGSWSRGNLIGNINSGRLFASYNIGDEYTSGKQIELVDTGTSKTAAYTVTSTENVVYKKGKTTLNNGSARVTFDENYKKLLGDIPVVTATPMGLCNGIYIESVDKNGFTIKELSNGTSNVAISWIAVGDRIDANRKSIPNSVLSTDFDSNLNDVMFNENDLNDSGKAMWSNGRMINFGKMPENLIDKPVKKEEKGN